MATSERRLATEGLAPASNDIIASVAIVGAYIARFGTIAEGVAGDPWLIPLVVTTDFLLPVLGAVWMLMIPAWSIYRRIESR